MGLFGMLFILFKLVKIGIGMASYTLTYSFLMVTGRFAQKPVPHEDTPALRTIRSKLFFRTGQSIFKQGKRTKMKPKKHVTQK